MLNKYNVFLRIFIIPFNVKVHLMVSTYTFLKHSVLYYKYGLKPANRNHYEVCTLETGKYKPSARLFDRQLVNHVLYMRLIRKTNRISNTNQRWRPGDNTTCIQIHEEIKVGMFYHFL